MRFSAVVLVVLGLAACAVPSSSDYASGMEVVWEADRKLTVKGRVLNRFDHESGRCAAGRALTARGLSFANWVSGRLYRVANGWEAEFVFVAGDSRSISLPDGVVDEVRGGAEPAAEFLQSCG